MYLLKAPIEKFGRIPAGYHLITKDVLFHSNIAFCSTYYWYRMHERAGCINISPPLFTKLRKKRILQTILVFARGGVGDTMWAMPAVRALREKFPKSSIMVISDKKNAAVWKHVPYISGVEIDEFWNVTGFLSKADEAYDFSGIVTYHNEYKKLDPIESCFKVMELDIPKDRRKCRPMLVITVDEGQTAEKKLNNEGVYLDRNKIITIGIESTTSNRNWPFHYTKELTKSLVARGYKVIWLGSDPEKRNNVNPNLAKETGAINFIGNTTIRQAMSIIALSDVFVGPSSGLLCISTALEIPSVGLWGAFSPACRSKYYEKYTPLWGKEKCSPCDEHWTECRLGHPAPCMKKILPRQVFDAVEKLLLNYPRCELEKKPID